MKKLLPFIFALTAANPSYADLSHSITASTKLTVGGASTTSSRLGNSYSISGSGVDTSYTTAAGQSVSDGLGSLNVSSGVATAPSITVTQKTAGNIFTFSQSYNQGDAIPGIAVTTGTNPNFSDNVSSIAGGTAGDLAGTVTSAGAVTLTAGGHNTEALGQITSTLIVD